MQIAIISWTTPEWLLHNGCLNFELADLLPHGGKSYISKTERKHHWNHYPHPMHVFILLLHSIQQGTYRTYNQKRARIRPSPTLCWLLARTESRSQTRVVQCFRESTTVIIHTDPRPKISFLSIIPSSSSPSSSVSTGMRSTVWSTHVFSRLL